MPGLVRYPDPLLLARCEEVTPDDVASCAVLVELMIEAMYLEDGVGLAAPRLGFSRRIVVVDPSGGEDGLSLVAMINPSITWRSDELATEEEGCLSVPGVRVTVVRPYAVKVEFTGLDSACRVLDGAGALARIVQHEVDHLDGRLMLDAAGPMARRVALKQIRRSAA